MRGRPRVAPALWPCGEECYPATPLQSGGIPEAEVRPLVHNLLPIVLAVLVAVGALLDAVAPSAPELSPADREWLEATVGPRLVAGDIVYAAPPTMAAVVARVLDFPVRAGYPGQSSGADLDTPRARWVVRAADAAGPFQRLQGAAEEVQEGPDDVVVRRQASGSAGSTLRVLSRTLEAARVSLDRGGRETPCSAAGAGFRCGSDDWAFVAPYVGRVDGSPSVCVWAHPYRNAELAITLPDTPLGERIVGRYALLDTSGDRASVRLTVSLDDRELAQYEVAKSDGWHPFKLSTAAAGRRGTLRFGVRTEDNRWRKLCFDVALVAGEGSS